MKNMAFHFIHEKARRNTFSTKNRIKYEEITVDHVLATLLPPFVRARFNSCNKDERRKKKKLILQRFTQPERKAREGGNL